MGTNNLRVTSVLDAREAVQKGYDTQLRFKNATPLTLDEVLVVQKGTQAGNPTVDLILTDENGKVYVAMITGAILSAIPCRPKQ